MTAGAVHAASAVFVLLHKKMFMKILLRSTLFLSSAMVVVAATNERSGSRFLVSGVGTQIMITSQPESMAKSLVAVNLAHETRRVSSFAGTASIYESPRLRRTTFSSSMSKP